MLGTRTQGGRMVGAEKSTELLRHPTSCYLSLCDILISGHIKEGGAETDWVCWQLPGGGNHFDGSFRCWTHLIIAFYLKKKPPKLLSSKNQIVAIALFPFSCSYAHYQLEAFVMVAWKLECKKSKIKCSWLFGASFLVQNPMAFFIDTFAVMSVVSWETQSTVQWSKSLIGLF